MTFMKKILDILNMENWSSYDNNEIKDNNVPIQKLEEEMQKLDCDIIQPDLNSNNNMISTIDEANYDEHGKTILEEITQEENNFEENEIRNENCSYKSKK